MRKVSGPFGENALPILALGALVWLILLLHLDSAVAGTKVPIVYEGDGPFYGMMIRQIMEEGCFPALNHRLGAPFGSDLSDYPMSEANGLEQSPDLWLQSSPSCCHQVSAWQNGGVHL